MKHKEKPYGFTLIELLVVIAIIGILASVVLSALNTARDKGSDAAVKSNLSGARAAAEVEYDDAGATYAGVCADATVIRQITAAKAAAAEADATGADAVGASATATCNDTAAGYAIQVPLKSNSANWFCVDYQGRAQVNTANGLTATTDVTCN